MSLIRVGIVDDHAIVRTGLRQFLSEHVDVRVTGEAHNGKEALELARQGEVDVLLMDISMPDQSGVDALQSIKARFPDLPVLILSGFPEAHYATTLLRQGAAGYLNKECEPDEIVNAKIRKAREANLKPLFCIGETLAEREAGRLEEVLRRQITGGLHGVGASGRGARADRSADDPGIEIDR